MEPIIELIAPDDIRESVAEPMPGDVEEERKRRDDVFFSVPEASGY